jgi:hypothetical protein
MIPEAEKSVCEKGIWNEKRRLKTPRRLQDGLVKIKIK